MRSDWTAGQLRDLAAARELEITTVRDDGTRRAWVPIWVVTAGADVYVRTWFRRDTGWFGRAVAAGRARIRVDGVETDVAVVDVGASGTRPDVDAAYLAKYGAAGADRMVDDTAAATTLRLDLRG